MSEAQEPEDKTEEASERRIEQALERGDVPKSADLQGFLILAGGFAATAAALSFLGQDAVSALAQMLAGVHRPPDMASAVRAFGIAALTVIGPMLVIAVAAIAAALALHRPMLVLEPLLPKFSRVNPGAGAKRLFGKDNLVQFAKTSAKLAAVFTVLALVLWPERGRLIGLTQVEGQGALLREGARLAAKLCVSVLLLYAAIAVLGVFWARFSWKKRLRMSKQEVKEENKESEGNPEIKARVRAIRQRRARQRMMAAVPKATVILVNPTHYAVALRYEAGMAAPQCVAKGVDELALRIREIAREHRIAIVENPPLARALHATVEIDETIPAEHYKAVAEVIGFVLRARRRRA